ncbi:hypothetical protein DWF00_16500 [Bosea caraganae]|nr:hypothetical protein [Bosea caraganae]RDJ24823.1 hypothetical protein DWF00_16500 [Bosea caraganae]
MSIEDNADRHYANRYRARLRRQRSYQADYREKLKMSRTPDREDMAACLLRLVVRNSARDWEHHGANWERVLVKHLSERGFDMQATSEAFRGMLDREVLRLRAKADREQSDG